MSSYRKRRLVTMLVVAGVAAGFALPATAGAALISDSGCIQPSVVSSQWVEGPATGASWQTFRPRSSSDDGAAAVTNMMNRYGVWDDLHDFFGHGPIGGEATPFPIYVGTSRQLGLDAEGALGALEAGCSGSRAGIVVFPSVSLATLTHEFFHAFQYASVGRITSATAWLEATAEWWNYKHSSLTEINSRDYAFLRHPEIPLFDITRGASIRAEHPYGAFRFVDFLYHHVGEGPSAPTGDLSRPFAEFLDATFRTIGSGGGDRAAVTGALAARRSLFGDYADFAYALGRFWAEQAIRDNVAGGGPIGGNWRVPVGTDTREFSAQRDAADIVRMRLQSSAGIKRIVVSTDRGVQGRGGKLWLEYGGALHDWSSGPQQATFCVGGGNGYAWNGSLPIAFTDTGSAHVTLKSKVSRRRGSCGTCPDRDDVATVPASRISCGWTFEIDESVPGDHLVATGTICTDTDEPFGTWNFNGVAQLSNGTVEASWNEVINKNGAPGANVFSRLQGTYFNYIRERAIASLSSPAGADAEVELIRNAALTTLNEVTTTYRANRPPPRDPDELSDEEYERRFDGGLRMIAPPGFGFWGTSEFRFVPRKAPC